jgi:hypothetical protein
MTKYIAEQGRCGGHAKGNRRMPEIVDLTGFCAAFGSLGSRRNVSMTLEHPLSLD